MNPGKLDRRISIERATRAEGAFGSEETWAEIATVWSGITPVSDGERWRAGSVGATVTHRFLIRYSSQVADLNPKDRLIHDGRTYNISGVKEIGRRERLEITAAAKVD